MSDQEEKDIDKREHSEPEDATDSPSSIDEGPTAAPVDDIQAALFEAARAGVPADVDFDRLAQPRLELDDEPSPVDEIRATLQKASEQGLSTDVDFDTLPSPTKPVQPVDPSEEAVAISPETPTAPPPKPTPDPVPTQQPQPQSPARPAPAPLSPPAPDLWLVIPLFVVFRLLTLFLLRPGGYLRDWSDFDTYFGISGLSDYGLFPFFDFWLEWPPLVPWLAVGAYRLALNIPPWPDDTRLWFILILGTIFLLFEIGNLVLIHRLARRIFDTPTKTNRVLWLYVALFPPLYAMLGFFDGVALFFILLALDLVLDDRRALSAVAVGVGILVKVIPLLILPVAVRRIWYQHRHDNREATIEAGLYIVIAGLTVILLLAPFLIMGPQWVTTWLRATAGRSSWETVWAILEGYYGFGVVLGDRLDPAEANFAIHQGWLPWSFITLLFVGVYLIFLTRRADYHQPRNVVALTGLTATLFLLYSKGYSPQFLVYVLPFIVLLMPNGRGVTYAIILTILNVLAQPVYFVMLPDQTWLLTSVVIARTVVLLFLLTEFALVLWPFRSDASVAAQVHRYVPVILGGVAALALLILTPMVMQAYTTSQSESTAVGKLTQLLLLLSRQDTDEEPRLLLNEQVTYRQLYPYLHDQFDLNLTDGAEKGFPGAATVSDLTQDKERIWVVATGPKAGVLTNPINARGTEIASYEFDDQYRATLYSFERNPLPVIPPVRFLGGIELLAHEVNRQPGAVDVTLFWRAQVPQNQNLTVFTQLLNAEGELVASHDSVPLNGTAPVTAWPVGQIQADPHRIQLPNDLAPGEYTLVTGLYNDANDRVRGTNPTGVGFVDRAVPLETLTLQ